MTRTAAFIAASALGLVLVIALVLLAFGFPVGPSLVILWDGAFGSPSAVSRTFVRFMPILLAALGIMIAWRASMFNIGGEGQLIVGLMFGAAFYKFLGFLPPALVTFGILVFCALGGAFWGAIAGALQAYRGVQVVISTILMNFTALQLLGWAVSGPLQQANGQLPLSDRLPREVMFYRWNPQMDLHAGLILCLLLIPAVWFILYRTTWGFQFRLFGQNPKLAPIAKFSPPKVQISVMAISGALCGLAGAMSYLGVTGQIGTSSAQDWGFIAIPVAIIGGLQPLGTAFSSLFFASLYAGSDNLARFQQGGQTIVYVVQGIAVLGYAAFWAWNRRLLRREAVS
ncbi:MAG: ABC transporter permease [Fimbriimonadaceae bacterium]